MSKFLISAAAMRTGNSVTSKLVIAAAPTGPPSSAAHVSSSVFPMGDRLPYR